MVTFLLVSVILLFVVFILHIVGVVKDGGKTDRWEHIVASLLTTFVIVALWCMAAFMDVYEGKTEVKYDVTICCNDTIVDSTVVFKENK